MNISSIIEKHELLPQSTNKGNLCVFSPINGEKIARVQSDNERSVREKIELSYLTFKIWRNIPAPKRGEIVRLLGEELRANKELLGQLVTLESGKILEEGIGEVQEMIDICDFAVGLSRQLYGLTIASERVGHRMMETWHPIGVCGVISAFNFPVAVWSWNFTLSLVCGNPVLWKPSEKTPLTALACNTLFNRAIQRCNIQIPDNLLQIILGDKHVGNEIVTNKNVAIISATGSSLMGQVVGPKIIKRFGRPLLELGGNNAMIVAPTADLEMAEEAIVFSAVGTAGQRCTSLRRLIIHEDIYSKLLSSLKKAYKSISIGSPLNEGILIGPLISKDAYTNMQTALLQASHQGGKVTGGERVLAEKYPAAYYVNPALVEMPEQTSIVMKETFAPILYIMKYDDIQNAILMNNSVGQGLSSCIFTNDLREAELFMSPAGSDCGIVNVNIGPSGAEIGGAFGGEKETGGGRESGSDAWKNYMRRATNTVNYSSSLPLAQGISFGSDTF